MRVVAVGDVVTWGRLTHGYKVVKVTAIGVYVDGDRYEQGHFFVPWSGDGATAVRHLCGDRIDPMGSFAARLS